MAEQALARIRKLYAIERRLPSLLPPTDDPGQEQRRRHREEQRRATRQREARPVLDELEQWLEQQRTSPAVVHEATGGRRHDPITAFHCGGQGGLTSQ
jgi:hypothetical protein